MYQSVLRFFGLTPETKADVQLEQFFLLAYYLGLTRSDIYDMPVAERMWYLERVNEEIKKSADNGDPVTKATHDNTPDQRAFRGQRPNTPARLRRFT